jgi:hypothetical protein
MAFRSDPVEAALERWRRDGLIDAELADLLRAEAREHDKGSARRTFQYVLAGTGGLILLIAAGVFADWLWPRLQLGGRAVVLGITGVVVHTVGLFMREGERWRAASYLLQITGLLILLFTYGYSDDAWPAATVGGIVIGVLALVTPLVTAPRSFLRKDPVMPAAHLALGLAFLAVFLWRTFDLSANTIIWFLDGVLAVLAALLVVQLRSSDDPEESEWALYAFVTAMYAGFVLIALTGLGPFDLETRAVYPMDVWLLGIALLALWGIHAAPPALQRHWYERHLALALLIAIPLIYQTFEWSNAEVGSVVLAAVGALALNYSIRTGGRATLYASCFAIIVAAWVFGVDQAGAIGVVLALAASAAFLFWISTRVGWTGSADAAAGKS